MKIVISLLILVSVSLSSYSQEKNEIDYLKEWNEFKKENAPFNNVKKENLSIDVLEDKLMPKLGDLSYDRRSYTTGQELIGVVLHVAGAIKDHYDRNEIWKDPAKYFVEGYY